MELGGASRYSTGFGAMEEGLMSSGGRKLRVPLHFLLGSQGASRAAPGKSCLLARGEKERVIVLESWEGTRA